MSTPLTDKQVAQLQRHTWCLDGIPLNPLLDEVVERRAREVAEQGNRIQLGAELDQERAKLTAIRRWIDLHTEYATSYDSEWEKGITSAALDLRRILDGEA